MDPTTQDANLSKSAMKRLKKQEMIRKKKEEKEQSASGKGIKKTFDLEKLEISEIESFYNTRAAIVNAYDSSTFYPHKFYNTTSIASLQSDYSFLSKDEVVPAVISVSGRIISKRKHGKLFFYSIEGDQHAIQLLCSMNEFASSGQTRVSAPETTSALKSLASDKHADHFGDLIEPSSGSTELFQDFFSLHRFLMRGDLVGVTGKPTRTKAGELSLMVSSITLLSPCLRHLPSKYYSLKDTESRYRNRSLDLILNESTRRNFVTRAKVIAHFRESLVSRGFMEVETPTLAKLAGGAAAKPFQTHLNDMGLDLFLRIAPELYLKKLIIGGFDKVFEIGKSFRNEGVDATHNPEFTSLEYYEAYADYRDGMKAVEEMVSGLVLKLFGKYKIDYEDKEIDFTPPFRRVSFMEGIKEGLRRDNGEEPLEFPEELEGEEMRTFLVEQVRKRGLSLPNPPTTPKLLDKLCGEYVESTCVSPTFIIEQPQIMSPLAKFSRDRENKKGLTERFELFVCKFEVANAYTELNNPKVQRETFAQQSSQKEAGDDEVPAKDEDFCRAMDFGMPPTCGVGIGIDRLVMLMTNTSSIKEVILFPLLKDKDGEQ